MMESMQSAMGDGEKQPKGKEREKKRKRAEVLLTNRSQPWLCRA
jgi:hypothetical protein